MLTRSEWVTELKRYISILPEKEQKKAVDYYNEIFEDKYESGMSEKQIVDGFGSPYDAATTIINEYQTENPDWKRPTYDTTTGNKKSNPYGDFTPARNYSEEPNPAGKKEKSNAFEPANWNQKSNADKNHYSSDNEGLSIFLCIIVGIILYPVAISIAAALISACMSLIIGGGLGIFWSIYYTVTTTSNYLAAMGACIAAVGIGVLLIYPVIFGCKWMFHGITLLFKFIRKELTGGEQK